MTMRETLLMVVLGVIVLGLIMLGVIMLMIMFGVTLRALRGGLLNERGCCDSMAVGGRPGVQHKG